MFYFGILNSKMGRNYYPSLPVKLAIWRTGINALRIAGDKTIGNAISGRGLMPDRKRITALCRSLSWQAGMQDTARAKLSKPRSCAYPHREAWSPDLERAPADAVRRTVAFGAAPAEAARRREREARAARSWPIRRRKSATSGQFFAPGIYNRARLSRSIRDEREYRPT